MLCRRLRSFVAALEEVLSGWLAAGPEALAAESEAAACVPQRGSACNPFSHAKCALARLSLQRGRR